jgi:hypothetical protein
MIMKTNIFIITLLLLFIMQSCTERTAIKYSAHEIITQAKRDINDEADIYKIVNLLLEDHPAEPKAKKSLSNKFMPLQEYPPNFFDELNKSSIFSTADKTYIREQFKDTSNAFLKESLVRKDVKIIPEDTIQILIQKFIQKGEKEKFWNHFYKNYGEELITIGKPYFSRDGNKAVAIIGRSRGPSSGGGYKYYLQKTDGRWKVIKSILVWIS